MTQQGPIQRAIRARIAPGSTLRTAVRSAPFVVDAVNGDGIVLLLGAKQARTAFDWECIEGIGAFLRGRGWVESGSTYEVRPNPGTLDGYLKGCINRATANWVARLLEEAGVVDLDGGRPLRVRLRTGF
ncbi:MAG: hypothetical protein WD904_01965 [Dehalococcoidia bacterium]